MNEKSPFVKPKTKEELLEERIENEVDKQGISYHEARARYGAEALDEDSQPAQPARQAPARRRRYASSKNPDNDSDQDPHWRGGSHVELSPEEKRSRDIGIAACRAALIKNKPSS